MNPSPGCDRAEGEEGLTKSFPAWGNQLARQLSATMNGRGVCEWGHTGAARIILSLSRSHSACGVHPRTWGPSQMAGFLSRSTGVQSWAMLDRPQKITFADMRDMGVRGLLIC
jgi:hypothetical protein